MVDWIEFLDSHNIPYTEEGPNVAANHINVKCPWCGDSDPSEHLGIDLTVDAYGCWRDSSHRGYKPAYLVAALLDVTLKEANALLGNKGAQQLGNFLESVDTLFGEEVQEEQQGAQEEQKTTDLMFPPEFSQLRDIHSHKAGVNYLVERGFDRGDVDAIGAKYNIQYVTHGYWKSRIIFPVYVGGSLITWTGRTTFPNEAPRYKTLSSHTKDQITPISDTLFNFDDLVRYPDVVLFVCEGPFDALKVDWYTQDTGVRATCLFGSNVSLAQRLLLDELSNRFDSIVYLVDQDTSLSKHLKMMNTLGHKVRVMPEPYNDPGDIPKGKMEEIIDKILPK